jgi:hypothetical protein
MGTTTRLVCPVGRLKTFAWAFGVINCMNASMTSQKEPLIGDPVLISLSEQIANLSFKCASCTTSGDFIAHYNEKPVTIRVIGDINGADPVFPAVAQETSRSYTIAASPPDSSPFDSTSCPQIGLW